MQFISKPCSPVARAFNLRPSAASCAKRQVVLRTAIQGQSVLQKGAHSKLRARTFAEHHPTIELVPAHSASLVSVSRCVSLRGRRFPWLTAPTRALGGWKCAQEQPIEPVSQVVQTSAAYLRWPFPFVSVTSRQNDSVIGQFEWALITGAARFSRSNISCCQVISIR